MTYGGVKLNKKNGATISVKKRGRWNESYKLARILAQWASCSNLDEVVYNDSAICKL